MKRIVLLLMMCAASVLNTMQAQSTYQPVLEDGKSWLWAIRNRFVPETRYFTVEVLPGDTVAEGRTCKRLLISFKNPDPFDQIAVAYEEDKKVYLLDYRTPQLFSLMMDFNLTKGDKIYYDDGYESYEKEVLNDEIIQPSGRRKLTIGDQYNIAGYWVEGIGGNGGNGWMIPIDVHIGDIYAMLQCYMNGECIFAESDFGGTSSIKPVIPGNEQSEPEELYDISGTRATTPQKGRIYISRSGKKIIW